MRDGVVVKALNIWYLVQTEEGVVPCRPRGRLNIAARPGAGRQRERREGRTVLVGDRVRIRPEPDGTGVIHEVLPRTSELVRPPVANVDQVLLVAGCRQPAPNLDLVDRVLVLAAWEGVDAVIAFNKADLLPAGGRAEVEGIAKVYGRAGYRVLLTSAVTGEGVDALRQELAGRITVLAGESGVGKSSLLNAAYPGMTLRTGAVSHKAGRGRHTTRHVELLGIPGGGWVADAPGFTRLEVTAIPPDALGGCFPEIAALSGGCRFPDCLHREEPGCAVREAVARGEVDRGRYGRYRVFLEEIRAADPYR